MKCHSLKHRLILSVLLVELLSAICVCALAFAYEHHARFRSFDIMLRGRADSLLGAVQDAEDAHDNVMLDGTEANLPRTDIFEVWDQNLRVLGKSPNWVGVDPQAFPSGHHKARKLSAFGHIYGVIAVSGVRVVDPGDKGGGIPRPVLIVYGSPLEPVWDSIWEAVEFYALTSLALLALTAIVMYWLLNRELAPLAELASQASRVSTTSWEFQPSPAAQSTQELAPLALALQTLLKGLERSFLQQQQFVGDAAHELKTGVSVVKSSLQLLVMKSRTVEEYQAGLERCETDCHRLEEIVSGMLALARADDESSVPMPISEPPVTNLATSLDKVIQQLASLSEVQRVPIRLSASQDLYAAIDSAQFEIVLSNILTNAIQHSSDGSAIEVSAARQGDSLQVLCVDHGDGIDSASLPYVFDRFYRSDPSRSRRTGGTGLGLSICHSIMKKAHGTITISSQVGRGTTVEVCLPSAGQAVT